MHAVTRRKLYVDFRRDILFKVIMPKDFQDINYDEVCNKMEKEKSRNSEYSIVNLNCETTTLHASIDPEVANARFCCIPGSYQVSKVKHGTFWRFLKVSFIALLHAIIALFGMYINAVFPIEPFQNLVIGYGFTIVLEAIFVFFYVTGCCCWCCCLCELCCVTNQDKMYCSKYCYSYGIDKDNQTCCCVGCCKCCMPDFTSSLCCVCKKQNPCCITDDEKQILYPSHVDRCIYVMTIILQEICLVGFGLVACYVFFSTCLSRSSTWRCFYLCCRPMGSIHTLWTDWISVWSFISFLYHTDLYTELSFKALSGRLL